ncbi:FAD:protein FMN transferase [Solirubrobacter sp. CPCC 204708]|uniref:FAD:protein FMN transferase n=1 Tax=Solirubrobacter deserti TaxID=2282478 RepID=A0ABT4RMK9_9ACTN|nr:FAD:protein FMN transferase [Solirubrobacter deserti]MBE2316768.1 FAD:protein FMN transferase [Solirubrobacter deserti]MDA0139525.1 FAD:protein FMN transferase [Solirubrobacter deserti]
MTDVSFDCMGTTVRLVVADEATALACREFLTDFDRALSRFRPDSELSRLNADPREEVDASALLRGAISAGLMAAELTEGLVDPTLTAALEANGYDRTRRDPELPLKAALAQAPPRRPAGGSGDWMRVVVTDHSIRRPPGLRLDTGGIGKGLAVDMLALRLNGGAWAIDAGGDMRVSGTYPVEVRHPLTHEPITTLTLTDQAVATSGIDLRLWHAPDGSPRHHLLDPSTREPAWTGVIGATALAPTTTEADTLAKAALLSGPDHAPKWLRRHGGLFITDDGTVHQL